MKQLFILFSLMLTTPLLASGIGAGATSATCDNATFETYGGTANVEIDWVPNTIQTRWYNGNTLIDTTNTNAGSCEYDDVLNRPTNPTRTGYTFNGWTLRPEMDFSTITLPAEGMGHAIGAPSINNGINYGDGNNCTFTMGVSSRIYKDCSDNMYKNLRLHEWKVDFYGNGIIYGTGKCSAKSGNNNNDTWNNASSNWRATYSELESTSGDKIYCWCQLTGYTPNNSDTIYAPSNSLPWIFIIERQITNCLSGCAMWCSAKFTSYSGLRNAMLGITQ